MVNLNVVANMQHRKSERDYSGGQVLGGAIKDRIPYPGPGGQNVKLEASPHWVERYFGLGDGRYRSRT